MLPFAPHYVNAAKRGERGCKARSVRLVRGSADAVGSNLLRSGRTGLVSFPVVVARKGHFIIRDHQCFP